MNPNLHNTKFWLLCLISCNPYGVTAHQAAREKYGTSGQPLKKTKTMFRHLRELKNWGLLHEHGGSTSYIYTEVRFTLNNAGRDAARAESERRANRWQPTFTICGQDDPRREYRDTWTTSPTQEFRVKRAGERSGQ